MPLFRRRAGRHAAGQPSVAAPVQPVAAPWGAAHGRPAAGAPPEPAPPQAQPRPRPAPTGPVRADGQVRLGFADGSAITLAPDDPRARAFRALAKELGRRG